jgi:hypothetical protein
VKPEPRAALCYPHDMLAAVAASLFLGAVATLGDFIWAYFNLRHRPIYGLIHGAAFGLALGVAIGIRQRRAVQGAIAGPLVLVAAGALFYLLAPLMRMAAMYPAWMVFWVCFALLQRRFEAVPTETVRVALARGVAAAALSGAAFYAISGIWTERSPDGPNYVRNFLSWTFAFFPGFAALFTTARHTKTSETERGSGAIM